MTDVPSESSQEKKSVLLCSASDDLPQDGRGTLIPTARSKRKVSARVQKTETSRGDFKPKIAAEGERVQQQLLLRSGVAATLLLLVALVSGTGYGFVVRSSQAAVPVLSLIDPHTQQRTEFGYGPQPALQNPNLFAEARDAMLEERLSFIEADLSAKQLRYFKNGVLLQSASILAVAETGSWWDTPSGLYEVEQKTESMFSHLAQAYYPWQITFERNLVIHGWPTYPDGTDVMDEFRGGGIRLSTEDAEELYQYIRVGTPILVHRLAIPTVDNFVYEPRIPEMDVAHYFVADLGNGTVLAASDLDKPASIASLTKLMTAVVAAEEITLDGRISVTSPTFVTSLIPRLVEGSSVSVYSLLQLLLVESSNEAAETLAGEVGREAFVAAMNKKARQLGMLHTTFADPSGLSAENVSTVGDLYKLVQYIYLNRKFIFEITNEGEVPNAYIGGEFAGLINFNQIENVEGFIGGKVGETNAARQTSVSLHKLDFNGTTRTVAVILLGSEQRTADVLQLLSYVKERFEE